MNEKGRAIPSFFLQAWEGSEGVQYQEYSYQEYQYWRKTIDKAYVYDFRGKTARVVVLAPDNQITREIALRIANGFMRGNYLRIEFDLDQCTVSRTNGTIPINPPH